MTTYIDLKFIKSMQSRLNLFSEKKPGALFNFRCPICGDSKKNKNRARGYLYISPKTRNWQYKCHNCGKSCSFNNFLLQAFPDMHKQYVTEKYAHGEKEKGLFTSQPMTFTSGESVQKKLATEPYQPNILENCDCVYDLHDTHPAKVYLRSRQLPDSTLKRIYFTSKFNEFAANFDESYKDRLHADSRILFPLINSQGKIFGVNSRSLDPNDSLRYITIRYKDSTDPKYYGLDRFNRDKPGYAVEGPIDSEFLPNCIAFAGAGTLQKNFVPFDADKTTIIFDNEPRNKEICHTISNTIDNGFKVVIWPKWFHHKDINEAIMNGMTQKQVMDIIHENTHQDLTAKLKFLEWKRV